MGLSSYLLLIDQERHVQREHDFDKALDGPLAEIARSLKQVHPFRQLIDVLLTGTDDEQLTEALTDCYRGDGISYIVITPEQLDPFQEFVNSDLTAAWGALFPERQTGLLGWINYHGKLKPLAQNFHDKPEELNSGWLRDDFEALRQWIRVALEHHYFLMRVYY